jgi:Tfp pilus assembly major pilin PilA
MKPVLRFLGAALISIGLAVHAAQSPIQSAMASGPLRPIVPYTGDPLSAQPYLRARLPQGAMAYLRIPNFWALLGQPKGNIFSKAVGSEPYVKAVAALKEGAVASVLPEISNEIRGLVGLFVVHAASPLEAVLLPTQDPDGLPAQLLVSLKLDLQSPAEFSNLLEELVLGRPDVDLLAPLVEESFPPHGDGYAILQAGPFAVSLGYDADNARLTLLLSLGPEAGDLRKVMGTLRPVADHPMYEVEADLDASGQGLFLWLQPLPLLQLIQAMGDVGQQVAGLALLGGMSEARSLAFGMGTSRGKNRLALRLDMPRIGLRAFLPAVDTQTSFAAAGKPRGVMVLALPDTGDLKAMEELLGGILSPQMMAEYFEAKQGLREDFGLDVDEILSAVGEEAILVADDAGTYWALRIDDWDLAEKSSSRILAKLAEMDYRVEQSTREIGGITYHHARIPVPSFVQDDEAHKQEPEPPLMTRLMALPSNAYWVNEGDYQIVANLPQVLIDRVAIAQRVPLRAWLRDSQGVDPDGAMLLATLHEPGTPRLLYNLNLGLIEAFGDFVERPVDMFALPSAREADLPNGASYSFQLDSTADRVSLEISYDFSPFDILFMGGYQGAAVMGVLATIAVPAYQDYSVRAQVAGAIERGVAARQAVTDLYLSMGRFPNEQEAAEMGIDEPSDVVSGVRIVPRTGEVVVDLAIETLPGDATIQWKPRIGASGELHWECFGSFDDRRLPAGCRH